MAELAVVLIPKCVECDRMWFPCDTDRWQAYWVASASSANATRAFRHTPFTPNGGRRRMLDGRA